MQKHCNWKEKPTTHNQKPQNTNNIDNNIDRRTVSTSQRLHETWQLDNSRPIQQKTKTGKAS